MKEKIQFLVNEMGLSAQFIADHIGTSRTSVARWARGDNGISPCWEAKLDAFFEWYKDSINSRL